MVSNQTFIGLVPGEGIDKEYLYYMMESHANNLQKLSSEQLLTTFQEKNLKNSQ